MTLDTSSSMEGRFEDLIKSFIELMNTHSASLHFLLIQLEAMKKDTALKAFNELKNDFEFTRDSVIPLQELTRDSVYKLEHWLKRIDSTLKTPDILFNSFIISLVCYYDEFLSTSLQILLTYSSDCILKQDKSIKYCEIQRYNSIDELKQYLISKEIESVFRESHSEQVKKIPTLLGVKNLKHIGDISTHKKLWGDFIELTERRNLLVHNGGKIDDHYKRNCKKHKINVDNNELKPINQEYFSDACNCLVALGTIITLNIFKNIFPDKNDKWNSILKETTDSLIVNEHYIAVIDILNFFLKEEISHEFRINLQITLSQAYKWSEQEEKCQDVINKIDTSSISNLSKFDISVLRDKYDEAEQIIILNNLSINLTEYQLETLPLYKEFRKTDHYQRSYMALFNKMPANNMMEPKTDFISSFGKVLADIATNITSNK